MIDNKPIKPVTRGGREYYILPIKNQAWAEQVLGLPTGALRKAAAANRTEGP